MKPKKILVINGPNLDMLGTREPGIYGNETLQDIEEKIERYGTRSGADITCYQSNSEAKLINQIHKAPQKYDGIIYNPGAHTHYSYALRDAIGGIDTPVVEIHISDIDEREPFRKISVIAPACVAQVKGLGSDGYLRALDILLEKKKFTRLGEGYRDKYPEGENIIIAGEFPAAEDDVIDVAAFASTEELVGTFEAAIGSIDNGKISNERIALLRLACARLGIGAMLVRDTVNINWLTALEHVFDDEPAHALLVAANLALLHTDSRYSNAVKTQLEKSGSEIMLNDSRVSHAQFAYETLNGSEQGRFQAKMGIEDSVSYAEFVKLVEAFGAEWLAPTSDIVLGFRAVKDADEILRLRAAQAVTDAAFSYILAYMRPGMTEREVQIELEHFMLTHGADGLAFRSIVACGENGADPHAVPGETRLEAGQCVVMDFGARAYGYCSDMTRTVFLGQPSQKMAYAWNALRETNEAIESLLRPGVTGKEAHERAELILEKNGFGDKMGHGLGHGVGMEVHELPSLNLRNERPLVEGNVVTVEPGIYLPGEFGMRLEDFGVITSKGFDVFTQSTHEMVII